MARQKRLYLSALLGLVFILICFDVVSDLAQGATWLHVGEEIFISVLILACIVGLWIRLEKALFLGRNLGQQLQSVQAERDRYRESSSQFSKGLNEKVQEQFSRWQLSEAECDVCYLLLKGASTKDIADARSTSTKTVAQQLSQIYEKSGLKNRSELLAFFLEDLFLPE